MSRNGASAFGAERRSRFQRGGAIRAEAGLVADRHQVRSPRRAYERNGIRVGGPPRTPAYHRAMVVAIDVGNSAVKLALVHGERVDSIQRMPTADPAARTELARDIAALILAGGDAGAGEGICLVSVVPEWTEAVMHAAVALGASLLIADHASIPLDARLPNPERVGPDRLLDAYAAERLYGAPVIVVDLGTATTVDAVDARGAFVGGAIAPGIELGLRGLASDAALLPRVAPDVPATAIGTDTPSAIQSGVVLGHVGAVRELVHAHRTGAGARGESLAEGRGHGRFLGGAGGQAVPRGRRHGPAARRRHARPGPHAAWPGVAPQGDRRGPGPRVSEARAEGAVGSSRPLEGRLILLGVTGSIAAYKAAELVRLLVAAGADVQVLMTHSAAQFIGPLTLETLSRRRVMLDPLELLPDRRIGHIVAADSADAILVAPATARWLGAMANGLADDVVTATCLASTAPVVVAPAMDGEMYAHPATRANVERLRSFGYTIVEPGGRRARVRADRTGPSRRAAAPRRRGGRGGRRAADPRAGPVAAAAGRGAGAGPGPRRVAHRRHGRRHRRTDRSGALHRQPLHGEDGHCRRGGSAGARRPRDPHPRHDVRAAARGCRAGRRPDHGRDASGGPGGTAGRRRADHGRRGGRLPAANARGPQADARRSL